MKVLICDPISKTAVARMRDRGIQVDVEDTITPERLLEVVAGYEAVVVRSRTKIRKNVLEQAASLKVIVRGGVGVDNIDVEAAESRGIKVLNTPAASSDSVAELAIAYIFALARPIVQATESLRAGKWEKAKFHGSEVQGKTLGTIGMGRIGSAVAKRAAALGMIVLGYDSRSVGPAPYMMLVDMDELLARADYITLHIPLTEESQHLIDAEAIAKMKNGVKLIDCARGGVIDENALHDAIVAGKVAGAGLDVFENEPLTDNKLFTLTQVIGSPHMGASTSEATERIGDEVAEVLIKCEKEFC
jgi:D-3-phosphoglycerate dehydrogenase / 2-oxoglutarate reductase